jgi:tRNA U34 5-methylaminomethyl-2-thiouridine-forming methyltransferase MnmC
MEIIKTGDGSHTLFSPQFNEIYHSRHGAIQEGKHVFIKHGLQYLVEQGAKEVNIFEVGFGTGLNAILTLIAAKELGVKVYYESIELYPVPFEIVEQLNYSAMLEDDAYRELYHRMHQCTWNEAHEITPYFNLKKIEGSLLNYEPATNNSQLIYFDAFAPEHQAEMWTAEVMRKLYDALQPDGLLVSYCSKSVFQRALKEAGFSVGKLPGPPGKREMVRAGKLG